MNGLSQSGGRFSEHFTLFPLQLAVISIALTSANDVQYLGRANQLRGSEDRYSFQTA